MELVDIACWKHDYVMSQTIVVTRMELMSSKFPSLVKLILLNIRVSMLVLDISGLYQTLHVIVRHQWSISVSMLVCCLDQVCLTTAFSKYDSNSIIVDK